MCEDKQKASPDVLLLVSVEEVVLCVSFSMGVRLRRDILIIEQKMWGEPLRRITSKDRPPPWQGRFAWGHLAHFWHSFGELKTRPGKRELVC